MVPGVGLELPSFGDVSPSLFCFSAASLPFSFFFSSEDPILDCQGGDVLEIYSDEWLANYGK